MDAHEALHHLAAYGNAATFIGVLLEGETVLVVAGAAVTLGFLDPKAVAASAVLAAILSDNFFFVLGRHQGTRVLSRFPKFARTSGKVFAVVERYPNACVLGMRFLYGTRTIGPAVIGAARIACTRWILLDGIAACLWTMTWMLVGMVSGRALRALADLSREQIASIITIAVAVAVLIAMMIVRSKPWRPKLDSRSGTMR